MLLSKPLAWRIWWYQMANGFLRLQGIQIDIPTGQFQDGPLLIPYSTNCELTPVPANSTNTTVVVPSPVNGVIFYPNGTAAMTCSAGFITSELTRLSPTYPTVWTFDQGAIPTDVFVTVSNTSGAIVLVRFF